MSTKKKIIWTLLAILLAGLSIWAVLSQRKELSVTELIQIALNGKPGWVIAAIVCMMGFIVFEGQALLCILKGIGIKRSQHHGMIYSSADIYFSAITPSATGGQPASALFMIKDGIPAAKVTAVLIANLIMYTLAILTIGVVSVIIRPNIAMDFSAFSKALIIFGFVALTLLAIWFVLMLRNRRIVYFIGKALITFLGKLRIYREPEVKIRKLARTMSDYKSCVLLMQGKYKMLAKVFLLNLLQRASQITVTAMMYMATGGSGDRVVDVWTTQSFTVIGSNCIPIPGAMGVYDYLLLDGLSKIVGEGGAVELELLSRGLSFYVCVLISAMIVLSGYFGLRRKNIK